MRINENSLQYLSMTTNSSITIAFGGLKSQ